jgi:hypothetical protein
MSSREHQQAMDLAAQAGSLAKEGRGAEAISLYEQAADWEQKALRQLSTGKVRTRRILGISLASLLYKARAFERAETVVREVSSQADLPASIRREAADLIQAIQVERAVNGTPAGVKDAVHRK